VIPVAREVRPRRWLGVLNVVVSGYVNYGKARCMPIRRGRMDGRVLLGRGLGHCVVLDRDVLWVVKPCLMSQV
jgi:hypothetical protein